MRIRRIYEHARARWRGLAKLGLKLGSLTGEGPSRVVEKLPIKLNQWPAEASLNRRDCTFPHSISIEVLMVQSIS